MDGVAVVAFCGVLSCPVWVVCVLVVGLEFVDVVVGLSAGGAVVCEWVVRVGVLGGGVVCAHGDSGVFRVVICMG